jgi:phthiodiolone/phenolphthiodiolone dimycocerosates ketoreductase
MELGIHLVAAGDLYRVSERYTDFLDQILPDCIWLSDRLLVDDYRTLAALCGDESQEWREPLSILDPFVTAAALVQYMPHPTRFGIAATDFVRRAAPDLARAAYSLNQVLPAPLNMGFGAGEAINLTPLGYIAGGRPVAHFEKSVRQFKQINDEGIYCGERGAIPLGFHRHPSSVWIAGQRNRMLRIAAEVGDGWLPAWKMSPAEYRDSVASLNRLATAAGRAVPVAGLFAMPVIGPSRHVLLDHFRGSPMNRAVAFMASGDIWTRWGLEHPAGSSSRGLFDVLLEGIPSSRLLKALLDVPAEMIADILFLGNVQELLDDFWQLKCAGLQHLSLLLPDFSNIRISYGLDNFEAEFIRLCRELQSW